MKHNKIYKLKGEYISTPNSEQGEFICNAKDIIPTTERGMMILFELTDNENIEFITASQASVAMMKFFDMYKPITSFATVHCFVSEIKTL